MFTLKGIVFCHFFVVLEATMNLCHRYRPKQNGETLIFNRDRPKQNGEILICKATDSKHLIHAMKNILLQENVSYITKMKLNGCNITEISNETFNFSELDGIQEIDLSHNGLLRISSGMFYPEALDKLQKLNLDYNEISYLPSNQFIYLKKIKYLHINFNKIDQIGSDTFKNLKELDSITLSNNKITFLPNNLLRNKSLYKLTLLDFSFNNISVIPNRFLRSRDLEGLKRIYFQNNKIETVKKDMLPDKLDNILELNLSHNRIVSIDEILPVLLIRRSGSFQSLKSITLNVSYNQLRVQDTDYIQNYHKSFYMFYLYIQYNNISKFEIIPSGNKKNYRYVFASIPNGRFVVNSTGNQIFSLINLVEASTGININQLNQVNWSSLLEDRSDRILRIHNLVRYFRYKYYCDCDVLKYWSFLETEYFKIGLHNYKQHMKKYILLARVFKIALDDIDNALNTDIYNVFNNIECGSPRHLAGKRLHSLKKSDIQCKVAGCTDEKCICTSSPFNSTARIECVAMNIQTMPNILENSSLLEIYLGHNKIDSIPIPGMFISERVLLLDLSYNKIKHISKQFFLIYTNLNILNLAGNMLSTIPSIVEWNSLSNLSLIDISNNQFHCDCPGLALKETLVALNSRITVLNLDSIGCYFPLKLKDRIIYSLPDSLFGCPFVNLTLLMSLLLTFLLLLVILASLAFAFRYYIRLFLFVHCGWRFGFSYPKDGTLYDVFISYCEKDSDWVMEHLVNPLENLELPYKLCLHERDFLVGVPICDNITNAVEGSKCTLVVVSENWLESDWCQYEFRVAHALMIERRTRLLVVLQEKIPDNKIKGELRLYIKTFTYLDSANQLFWSRLLNDLPPPDEDNQQQQEQDQTLGNDMIELM